ncbi:hypothetical protein OG601_39405 [Streptomyces sp. NBC_01239]|nr:hypothetical protein [Streptomyces sp. NBC_01239]MCX4816668.1 hypothetical protein [Streptomyces sp. NBC_01239]
MGSQARSADCSRQFGIGTVSTSHIAWQPLIRFEHGGPYAGSITLTEFCERAGTGLQLADALEQA